MLAPRAARETRPPAPQPTGSPALPQFCLVFGRKQHSERRAASAGGRKRQSFTQHRGAHVPHEQQEPCRVSCTQNILKLIVNFLGLDMTSNFVVCLSAVPWGKSLRCPQSLQTALRTAPRCARPSARPSSASRQCIRADWAAPRACRRPSSLTSLHRFCQGASSSAPMCPAVMKTCWTRHARGGATALFPSRPLLTPTLSISTAQRTPACPWLTARPTSLPRRTLSQSAAQTRARVRIRAARGRGGSSRCSSHSSLLITWRITGQLQ